MDLLTPGSDLNNYMNATGNCGSKPFCLLPNSASCSRKRSSWNSCISEQSDTEAKKAEALLKLAEAPVQPGGGADDSGGSNTFLYVGIGAGVLVLGIILFMALRKKK